MTNLVRPDLRLRASWAEAVAEFDGHMDGSGDWEFDVFDASAEGAPAVIATLLARADPATVLPDDRVHCTYYWITDGEPEEFVGYLALRHSLSPWLLEEGGHIGYSVRPSRRREGHATRALALAVRRAGELGIERALVTWTTTTSRRGARSSAVAASTRTPATASGGTGSTRPSRPRKRNEPPESRASDGSISGEIRDSRPR